MRPFPTESDFKYSRKCRFHILLNHSAENTSDWVGGSVIRLALSAISDLVGDGNNRVPMAEIGTKRYLGLLLYVSRHCMQDDYGPLAKVEALDATKFHEPFTKCQVESIFAFYPTK